MPTAVAPRAAPSSLLHLALATAVVLALAISSCSATTDAPASDPGAREMVVVRDDPKCEEMVPCTFRRCIQYCVSIGLQPKGFCNWKPNMQVYCCCVIERSVPPIDTSAALLEKVIGDEDDQSISVQTAD